MTQDDLERFFDGHAPIYLENCFTKNTIAEVDFLERELALPKGSYILDVGCGTGRHSVELARRGYMMTGVDLSAGMLAEAAKTASEAGVSVEFAQCDATKYVPEREYDAVICLCEGAFGLLGTGEDLIEHELALWRLFSKALKPGGKLILNALHAARMFRLHSNDDVAEGIFDPVRVTETSRMEWESPNGNQSATFREHGCTAPELMLLARAVGLQVEDVWGGTAGNWGKRAIDLDEYELMVIASKPK